MSSRDHPEPSVQTALEAARGYLARGWQPLPLPAGSKAPTLPGWSRLRLTASELGEHFDGAPRNVGVLLGAPSGGLVDVDLDSPEALALADLLLPPTASRFGRASKPGSHRLYLAEPLVQTEAFTDAGADGTAGRAGMLVELRATGAQTMFPPSRHPSGESVVWEQDGEPARLSGPELRGHAGRLAAAALLARHWPALGVRHHAALAAGGVLLRCGLDRAMAAHMVRSAARFAGDEEWADRGAAVESTATVLARGDAVTGGPRLAEYLRGDGARVVARIRQWLGVSAAEETLACTDAGNARRFARRHGTVARYCHEWGTWLLWTGTHWRRDVGGGGAMRLAKDTAQAIPQEAAAASGEDTRRRLLTWAARSQSEPGLRRMLGLAQSELSVEARQFDADSFLLNCPNGTLDLRTRRLRPHRPEDLLLRVTAAPYDPDARHPVWDRFLARVLPAGTLQTYVQRAIGYMLTGSTREEKLFLVYGPTASGKSTLLGALRRVWGDYAATADISTFAVRRWDSGPREDLARLHGARLVISTEVADGTRLAQGLAKSWTGGDAVVARHLYHETFEFTPQCKLVIAANHRPRVSDDDEALWRRIVVIPFTVSLPAAERDPHVKACLTDPAAGPAILAWAVRGVVGWLAHGLGSAPEVEAATATYRTDMDPLADFLAEVCVLDPAGELPAGLLRQAYETWCRDNGRRFPLSARKVAGRLEARGCRQARMAGGAKKWQGLRLRTPSDVSDASDGEGRN